MTLDAPPNQSFLSRETSAGNWREVEQRLEEIAELVETAEASAEPQQFYRRFLDAVVRVVQAQSGAIWTRNSEGQLHLEHQINLGRTGLIDSQQDQIRHGYLMDEVMQGGQPYSAPPRSGSADAAQGANPTPLQVHLCPVVVDGQATALVEVFHSPDLADAIHEENLQLLTEVCRLATDYYRNQQLRRFRQYHELWIKMHRMSQSAHGARDVRHTALVIANECRQILAVDRVTVLAVDGPRITPATRGVTRRTRYRPYVVQAISGAAEFDRRSATVHQLESIAAAAVQSNRALVYITGREHANLAPQAETVLQDYVDQAHCKSLTALLLKPPLPFDTAQDDESAFRTEVKDSMVLNPAGPPSSGSSAPVVGVMILEQFTSEESPRESEQVQLVCDHAAALLEERLAWQRLPFPKLMRRISQRQRTGGKVTRRRWLWGIALTTAAAVAAMMFFPASFSVEAMGKLQPKNRRHIFAPENADVVELRTGHGKLVTNGQIVTVLRDDDLELKLRELTGEIDAAQKRLDAIERLRLHEDRDRSPRGSPPSQLSAEKDELEERLKGLRRQLEILHERRNSLEVRSPMAGSIITWDLKRRLATRPVDRGEALMTIADLQGPWVLELAVADKNTRHVLAALRGKSPVVVTYVLQSDPNVVYTAQVTHTALATEVDENDRSSIVVVAKTQRGGRHQKAGGNAVEVRPGAVVIAHIQCGTRSLGYVWFRELIEAVQKWVLF